MNELTVQERQTAYREIVAEMLRVISKLTSEDAKFLADMVEEYQDD